MKIKLDIVRVERHMTIRELSQRSKVSKSHIQKIEANGSMPTIKTLYKLAQALDVSITDLYSCD